jgi:hypothetical protein
LWAGSVSPAGFVSAAAVVRRQLAREHGLVASLWTARALGRPGRVKGAAVPEPEVAAGDLIRRRRVGRENA